MKLHVIALKQIDTVTAVPGQDGYWIAKHAHQVAVTYEKAARDAQTIAQALSK